MLPSSSNNRTKIAAIEKTKNEENDKKASEPDQNQAIQSDTHIQPTRNLIDIYSSLLSIPPPVHQSDQNPNALAALTLFEKLNLFKSFYNQIAVNLQEAYTQAWTNNLINLSSQMRQNNGFHSNESSSFDVSPASTKVTESNSQANQESASDDGEFFDDECAEPEKFTDINLKQTMMSQENAQVASTSNGNSTKTKSKTNFSVEALLGVVK